MRALTWLWRAFLFFVLFAFALKNQHTVDVRGFFGYSWQAPMVFVMLAVFGLGCSVGVVAMVPSWWRHRRDARKRLHLIAEQAPTAEDTQGAAPDTAGAVPSQLPHPPDMPAPRKQGR